MSCPDLWLLSQRVDDELPADEAAPIDAHVAGCALCGARLERLRRAFDDASAAAASATAHVDATRTTDCPSPSMLAGWRDPALPTPDRAATERHLEACDRCLDETLAATRLLARLDATPAIAVPAALQARVAALWQETAAEPALSRLVVRVTRAGTQLLESHLLAPLRELVELSLPLPAMRGDAPASALSFKLHATDAIITTTVVPAGDSVGLTVVIEDDGGTAIADQRVFLRRQGRSVYSARTDAGGMLRVPGLERGVYEVACPGVGTAFLLDLR